MISLTSPVRTPAHDWPAGFKLAALCGSTFALFFIENVVVQALILGLILILYRLPGPLFFRSGIRQLKLLWPFVIIVGLWHGWTGEWAEGATIILRLISAVALANLVTMTTRLSDMIAVVQWLATPFRRFGLRADILALAIALVIRMVPVLSTKGGHMVQAWRARSARRVSWQIILPFTVLALDDADQVAEALRARGGLSGTEWS